MVAAEERRRAAMSKMPEKAVKRLPHVAMVTLTADRPQFAYRLQRNFVSQTYPNLSLVVLDTGRRWLSLMDDRRVVHIRADRGAEDTIGSLRNLANEVCKGADIIAHADDDDWSHPKRIEEQVALLEGSRATGYNQMLFWDSAAREAWTYAGAPKYMVGTSLCYWRDTWKSRPFPNTSIGEDTGWQRGLKSAAVSSIVDSPRMIACVHDCNTSSKIMPNKLEWRRAQKWDLYCEARMGL